MSSSLRSKSGHSSNCSLKIETQGLNIAYDDDIFNNPILQSFTVKSNLSIKLTNLVDVLTFNPCPSPRSGTIIALKYKNIVKGQGDLFKTKIGFKNACHFIMCHTLDKRKKKMVHIKLTANGTFQVVGIPAVDIEKVVYKVFLLLEKLNKKTSIFEYVMALPEEQSPNVINGPKDHNEAAESKETQSYNTLNRCGHNRLEIVIVPILNNYILTLTPTTTKKMFQNSKVEIVQKFIDNKFLSFMVPNDPAITVKKSFLYEEFSNHPIKYITWNKKYGKIIRYIEYDSYTTLLKGTQKDNAHYKKYLTLRLYSTGKVLISGFDEILIKEGVEKFLKVCDQF
jgi:hypothetical protein